jgi:nicotinamidase-related amidase/quercetin dioxygenase-like cupin family protein
MMPPSSDSMETDALTIASALPFAYRFSPATTALIVIDMQRDFIEAGGFGESLGNDVTPLQAIVPTVARLLSGCRLAGIPIIHTRESHKADLSDCPVSKRTRGSPVRQIGDQGPMGRLLIRGEPGTDIVAEVAPLTGEFVIDKPGKGAFYATRLGKLLNDLGVRNLLVAGVTTEVCVQSTVREANDRGYDCLILADATESYFPEFKQATLDMVRAQGAIVGWTAETDDLLAALKERPQDTVKTRSRSTASVALHVDALLDGAWQQLVFEPFRTGVDIARLAGPVSCGDASQVAVLRYSPGASVPLHEHTGLETILVLDGIQSDERGDYCSGSLVLNPVGTQHRVWSTEGCVVLIQWNRPVAFI